jgi:hypothetical protein
LTGSTITGPAGDISFEAITAPVSFSVGPQTVNTSARLVMDVDPKRAVSGSVIPCLSSSCTAIVLSFHGTYDPFNDRPASLAAVGGTFTGTLSAPGGNEVATLQVAADGAFSGSSVSGCTYKGALQPRSDTNTYDMQVDFTGGPCSTGSLAGIAYMDAGGRNLTAASLGFAFQGIRP